MVDEIERLRGLTSKAETTAGTKLAKDHKDLSSASATAEISASALLGDA